jgi:hypothetical protein
LQGVANVLDRALGVRRSQGFPAPIERTPAFGPAAPVDQPAALFCHNLDSLTTWL